MEPACGSDMNIGVSDRAPASPVVQEGATASHMEQAVERVLDTKGLNCPLPVLKAKKALSQVPAGGLLRVLSTDPGSVADFEAFCRQTGNELVESKSEDDTFSFLIRHAG